MLTLEDVKTNWREEKPNYNNLTDKTSMEYGLAQELSTVADLFTKLAEMANGANYTLVNRLKYGHIAEWEQIGDLIDEWSTESQKILEEILERFE